MKLKKYLQLLKEEAPNDLPWEKEEDKDDEDYNNREEYFDDEEDQSPIGSDDEDDDFEDDEEDASESEVMGHLASTIRNMIANIKVGEFYVDWDGSDISIQFVLNKKERLQSIMKILGVLKKLQTDILIQYDAEVDLWETKEREPLFTVNFYYDAGVKGTYDDEEVPF
jgi:hypothetical protein